MLMLYDLLYMDAVVPPLDYFTSLITESSQCQEADVCVCEEMSRV